MDSLRTRLSDADAALTKATARADSLDSSAATLKSKHETLRTQLAKETKRAEAAHTSREALLAENQGLLSQLEEMRERNGQVMKELAELGEERDSLLGSVAKLEVSSHPGNEFVVLRDPSQRQIQDLETAQQESARDKDRLMSEHEREVQLRKDTERDLKTTQEMLEQQNQVHNEQKADLDRRLEEMTVAFSEVARTLDISDDSGSAPAIINEIRKLKSDIQRFEEQAEQARTVAEANENEQDPVALAQTQHALEISNYASQLRSVESALHAESSRSHALSKQIADLQAELVEAKRLRHGTSGTVTPTISYRLAPTTTMIDEGLSPSVKQKRRAALALLKARLSAEANSTPGTPLTAPDLNRPFRSQLSEDAVFWCPCCDGDLISL